MTAIRSIMIPLAAAAAALVLPACYTLLKHPTVDTAAYSEVETASCTSCHHEDDLWYFHHSPAHRVYPGSSLDNWRYYYAVPWWYDSYWRYGGPAGSGANALPTRELRPGLDKDGAGAIGGPIGAPPSPKSAGGSVRVQRPDDGKAKDSKDTGDGKSNDDEIKKRDVRPKTAKEKPKGKEKE